MTWIPQFSSGAYAVAGLLCAAGPVLIHLLNRRRFRLVEWAAMDFLFEALRRQRRRLQLRDLLLLLLRTLAVLFFGLALARPYFGPAGALIDANSPRHLILLLDNSLSMGYRSVDTTLLDQARQQAGQLIDSLPDGSQVSIIGTCGTENYNRGPIRRKSDALELLADVQLVDDVSRVEDVVTAARAAIGAAAPLADQIVYFTDLQHANWPTDIDTNLFAELPVLQIHDLSVGNWDNSWVADVRLRDDIVDLDTPATVFATVRHQGPATRRTQISLTVNGQIVAIRSIELPPGLAERQVAFECSFSDAPVEPGDATFVPLEVSLTPDRLELDDRRTLMVPVVTSLPVVFVDQHADEDEDPALGQLGETRPLRHLLAPRSSNSNVRPLVDVKHLTIPEVNRSVLAPARLVVVAGVSDPSPATELFRQYVEQGGPLVIATGGDFDPQAWNLAAGRSGARLLPGHLVEQPLGIAPDEAGDRRLNPFSLALDTVLSSPLMRLPGLSDEELSELYQDPLFFKAVMLDMEQTEGQPSRKLDSPGEMSTAKWLTWRSPSHLLDMQHQETRGRQIVRNRTQVCARFANPEGTPFLVRHRIGKGEVLFMSSSVLPTWNNVAQTNAVVIWDHVLRTLIRSTLPQRTFLPQDQLSIPVPARGRGSTIRLDRPRASNRPERVDVGFIKKDQLGVTIADAWTRGFYRLTADDSSVPNGQRGLQAWQMEVAVNGNANESELAALSSDEVQSRILDSGIGQLVGGDSLGALEGGSRGGAVWWWLVLAVFVLLVIEPAALTAQYLMMKE